MIRGKSKNINYLNSSFGSEPSRNSFFMLPSIRITIVVIGFVIVSVAAGVTIVPPLVRWWPVSSTGACDKPPETIHTVLIDSSDPVSQSQRDQIDELINQSFLRDFRPGDHVNVVLLTHDQYAPVQWLYKGCDPGQGKYFNEFTNTKEHVERYREKEFLAGYLNAAKRAQVPARRPNTPLIQGLETITHNPYFQGDFGERSIPKRLLIISDALQHSVVSAYRKTLYGKRGQRFVKEHPAKLQNTYITMGVIRRPKNQHIQNMQHWQWINSYMTSNGASGIRRIDIY